jgi:hypothetical protein
MATGSKCVFWNWPEATVKADRGSEPRGAVTTALIMDTLKYGIAVRSSTVVINSYE